MKMNELKYSVQHRLIQPKKLDVYPIGVADWQHLKEQTQLIESKHNILYTMGSSAFSLAAACVIQLIGASPKALFFGVQANHIYWIAALIWFLFSLVFFAVGYKQRSTIKVSKKHVLCFIEHVESMFEDEDMELNALSAYMTQRPSSASDRARKM